MRRYRILTKVETSESMLTMRRNFTALPVVEQDPNGQWVPWEDVQALREYLEARIPELRIAKLEKALGLVSHGRCPECGQPVRDYVAPVGSFAPEAFATLREQGIDPATGHKVGCRYEQH